VGEGASQRARAGSRVERSGDVTTNPHENKREKKKHPAANDLLDCGSENR